MRKIIIWGTGKVARDFIEDIDFQYNQIIAFIDNNVDKIGQIFQGEFGGVPIIAPEKVKNYEYDLVVIGSSFYRDILSQCSMLGKNNKNDVNELTDLVAVYE